MNKESASVSTAISSTSQPVHRGFSTGGGAVETGVPITTESGLRAKESGTPGVGACGSAFISGCGSNCELSEDDKIFPLGCTLPPLASLGPVYGIHGKYAVWARLGVRKYAIVKTLLSLIERRE